MSVYQSANLGNEYRWHFKSAVSSNNYFFECCVCHSLAYYSFTTYVSIPK